MYLRAVRPGVWRRLRADGSSAVGDAAAELTRSGNDVSLYRCHAQREIDLVAVALSSTRQFEGHFDYLAIDDRLLEPYSVVATPGVTPLPDANALHRDVDLSGARAVTFVAALRAFGLDLRRIRGANLRVIARRLRDEGHPIPAQSWLLAIS